jgi:hypothetical protein
MMIKLEAVGVKSRWLVSAVAAVAFAATGCGSSSGGSCGVAPCGGAVTGSWKASSACVDRATLNMEFLSGVMSSCPTASLGAVTTTPTGTVSFAADMTFTGTLAVNTNIGLNFPPACTGGASCDQLTQALQSIVGMDGITAVSCAGAGSCVCTLQQTLDIVNDTGTWATSGTTLSLTGATNGAGGGAYCVKGSSLHLLDVDMATMMKVTGDIVLNKQ